TDFPEQDGTHSWDRTTLVLVEITAGGRKGVGFIYADPATAELIRNLLVPQIMGEDAMGIPLHCSKMGREVWNLGGAVVSSMAVSAVDIALWDLKAKLLQIPLATLLGQVRPFALVYGSGGFTSYSISQLREQMGRWAEEGISRVKMKVGSTPEQDLARVE